MKKILLSLVFFLIIVFAKAQNVGIGTSSPSQLFSVGGGSPFTVNNLGNTSATQLTINSASNQLLMGDINKGTLTWSPNSPRTITLPDVSGTAITTGNLTSIDAVGTIGVGTWHGTTVALGYGGTGADLSAVLPGRIPFIGSFSMSTSSSLQWDNTNSRLGIGTSSPAATLSVGSSSQFQVNGTGMITGTKLSVNASSGQLELGTTNKGTLTWSPTTTRTLTVPDVNGTLITSGNLSNITSVGTITSGTWNGSTLDVVYGGTGLSALPQGNILFGGTGGTQLGTSSSLYWEVVGGKLGIGTSSPVEKLSVGASSDFTVSSTGAVIAKNISINSSASQLEMGTTNKGLLSWSPTTNRLISLPDVNGTMITTGNLNFINSVGTITSGTWNGTTIAVANGGTGITSLIQGNILFGGTSGAFIGNSGSLYWDNTGLRLGIGTSSPAEKLSVGASSQFQVNSTGSVTAKDISLTSTSSQIEMGAANKGTLTWSPTATRTITLPDANGTAITTGNLGSITSVGTISSGTWMGTAIGITNGGTGITTVQEGRLLFGGTLGLTLATTNLLKWDDAAGQLGVGTGTPESTLDLKGTLGLKIKNAAVAGTDDPDNSSVIWNYTSGAGTITLPAANICPNRIYVIINRTGGARTISSYTDLSGVAQTTITSATALWLASAGSGWIQIK